MMKDLFMISICVLAGFGWLNIMFFGLLYIKTMLNEIKAKEKKEKEEREIFWKERFDKLQADFDELQFKHELMKKNYKLEFGGKKSDVKVDD